MRLVPLLLLALLGGCRPDLVADGDADAARAVVQVWFDDPGDPSTGCLTSRAATRLTGMAPTDHGLVFAGDLGAHRLSPQVPTRIESWVERGSRVVVAISSPQLAHELSGLWRGVPAEDRLEPDWRASRQARRPLDTVAAAAERVRALPASERTTLLVLQLELPELRFENLLPDVRELLLDPAQGLGEEARVLLREEGLEAFFEARARRRSSREFQALARCHARSWERAVRDALEEYRLGPEGPAWRPDPMGLEGNGVVVLAPPLEVPRTLILEADRPLFPVAGELPSDRRRLELPASESPARRFVPTLLRGSPIRMRLVPLPGSPHGGRAAEPEDSPAELGFTLAPTGPPLEAVPTDPEVLAFLRGLPSPR